MKQVIRVGSRDSSLAVIQAELVMKAIREYATDYEVELVTMGSFGDTHIKKAIDSYKKPNIFSDKLEEALVSGEIDIAVHSFKDLPIEENPDLPIAALGAREVPCEALILPSRHLKDTMIIGTSCKRRSLQICKFYPNWKTKDIRGTVPARLEQMDSGDYDGLVLAVAGLKRLGLESRISREFVPHEFIPSACQGIIAVQGRKNEDYSYLEGFDCEESHTSAMAELAFVAELNEDGSSYNNGVYAEVSGDRIKLVGMYITKENKIVKDQTEGTTAEGKNLAIELARELKKRGE